MNESNLTGESRPVPKVVGDAVSAGTINDGGGYIEIESTATSEDSAVARLVSLIEQAQIERSPTEKLVESVSKYYTPVVVLLSLVLSTVPWAWGTATGLKYVKEALVMLVVACPCALVISTPITYICGIATAARRGILVKGGQHLEVLAAVRRLAMDKTGTLTEGKFKMNDLVLLPTAASKGGKGGKGATSDAAVSKRDVLCLLAAVEEQSSHPLAAALVAAADEGGALPLPPSLVVDDFAIVPGEVSWGRGGEEGREGEEGGAGGEEGERAREEAEENGRR